MLAISRFRTVLCMTALSAALGCASSAPAPTPAPEAADPQPIASAEPKASLAMTGPGAPTLDPVFFDTDHALLRPDAREALKQHAGLIVQHPEWGVVTVEGHCDERGSEEYNLALGGRRAAAVVRYLADLGVPTSRLSTRTWGEARPAVRGHDEAAWRHNRRSELLTEAQDRAER